MINIIEDVKIITGPVGRWRLSRLEMVRRMFLAGDLPPRAEEPRKVGYLPCRALPANRCVVKFFESAPRGSWNVCMYAQLL